MWDIGCLEVKRHVHLVKGSEPNSRDEDRLVVRFVLKQMMYTSFLKCQTPLLITRTLIYSSVIPFCHVVIPSPCVSRAYELDVYELVILNLVLEIITSS